jgi:uncharacterized protein YifE (UPF0438 family)
MKTASKVIETIVTTSQGAKVKTQSTKASLTSLEILDLVTDSGSQVLAFKKAGDAQAKSLDALNQKIQALHNGGVRFEDGRKKDPQTASAKSAFIDSLGDDVSKTYKQDIWELFFKAVNSGKALKTLNKSRNKQDGAKGQKSESPIINILVKLYNHSDFETMLSDEVQAEIVDILNREGCLGE